jgi:hypothetical protein
MPSLGRRVTHGQSASALSGKVGIRAMQQEIGTNGKLSGLQGHVDQASGFPQISPLTFEDAIRGVADFDNFSWLR